MSLDRNTFPLSQAISLARKYYDEKTFDHAMRVMAYTAVNGSIPQHLREDCMALAMMHDLVEDTDFEIKNLSSEYEVFAKALNLLTKPKDMSYVDYCKRISVTNSERLLWENTESSRLCAYWVKMADMKDHLNLKDTLTDRLKAKYLEGLAELL